MRLGKLRPNSRIIPALLAFAFIATGTLARLSAPDWDSYAGLHADERHMAFMTTDAVRGFKDWLSGDLPLSGYRLWFDSEVSPLNPRQHSGFYVYGEFPLLVVSVWSTVTGQSDWVDIMRTGRLVSALADSFTILLVFFIANAWTGSRWAPVFAAGFYAAVPFAIREAHFFTVDTLSVFFGMAGVLAVSTWKPTQRLSVQATLAVLAGVSLGLSVASKPSGALFALSLAFLFGCRLWQNRPSPMRHVFGILILGIVSALLAFRLSNPYAFSGPGFWGLSLDSRFLDDLAEQAHLANAGLGWVPNWYWFERHGFLATARDLALVGLGPCLTAAFLMAICTGPKRLPAEALAGLAFVASMSLLFATYPSPYLRYALPLAPLVAVIAATLGDEKQHQATRLLVVGLLTGTVLQAQSVVEMLVAPHTRVLASAYLWNAVPRGGNILNVTSWDETLPVPVRLPGDKEARWPFVKGAYTLSVLGIQEKDTAKKAAEMAKALGEADALVLSSQRFSTNMTRLRSHFPMSARFFEALQDGSLCFQKDAEFRHDLKILGGLTFDDSWLQESWYIYDHPVVRVYSKTSCFSTTSAEHLLLQGLSAE